MDRTEDAALALARRLRALREAEQITQPQLAEALGRLSVPLISSWESRTKPKLPPMARLESYALFFAARPGTGLRLPDVGELSEEQEDRRTELLGELASLRAKAMGHSPAVPEPRRDGDLWRFDDEKVITIVCAELPEEMRQRMPYTDKYDPDYVQLYTYADLDALFELHGHIRAMNPASLVHLRKTGTLVSDDFTGHLVMLGGVDWNVEMRNALGRLEDLPVRQVNDWGGENGPYFDVNGERHHPVVVDQRLVEDVAHFYRGPNPYNRKRTITLCNGMFARGVYGAVRMLTDERFRDRNGEWVHEHFGEQQQFSLIIRVAVENAAVVTPDLTVPGTVLHKWPQ
ncbi:helix-turn-helix domain-containing protein [Acrocarpospora catenulata]|uniref:helix-turn-helix domain-containing protein n=1 Tax=Acrocarpospora catenulata TaxID=2836182 RepID=UPI001BD9C1D9|nr:helix-turn-helix domain-containing protein [Acrocarpospora catenulata]